MNTQQEAWSGDFGNSYTERNRVSWQSRVPFWGQILNLTKPETVLEVGCNAGWNLRALRALDPRLFLAGVDVNQNALQEAKEAGFTVAAMAAADVGDTFEDAYDLVFTAGVLIHIPSMQLKRVMSSIMKASHRYVLAVEYAAAEETEIVYRGQHDLLWKRPFGRLYELLGLKMVDSGFLTERDGFDSCMYWLLKGP